MIIKNHDPGWVGVKAVLRIAYSSQTPWSIKRFLKPKNSESRWKCLCKNVIIMEDWKKVKILSMFDWKCIDWNYDTDYMPSLNHCDHKMSFHRSLSLFHLGGIFKWGHTSKGERSGHLGVTQWEEGQKVFNFVLRHLR